MKGRGEKENSESTKEEEKDATTWGRRKLRCSEISETTTGAGKVKKKKVVEPEDRLLGDGNDKVS